MTVPDMLAEPTLALLDDTVYASASPSGSRKYEDTSTDSRPPTDSVMAGIVPVGSGARFGVVTVTATV